MGSRGRRGRGGGGRTFWWLLGDGGMEWDVAVGGDVVIVWVGLFVQRELVGAGSRRGRATVIAGLGLGDKRRQDFVLLIR